MSVEMAGFEAIEKLKVECCPPFVVCSGNQSLKHKSVGVEVLLHQNF